MDTVVNIKLELDKIPTGKEDEELVYTTGDYTFTVLRGEDTERLPGYTWFIHSLRERDIWNKGMTALCSIFCHDQDTGLIKVFDDYTLTYVYYQTNNYPRGPMLLRFVPMVNEEEFGEHEFCLTNREKALSDLRKESYYCKNENKKWIGYKIKDEERMSTRGIHRVLDVIREKGYFDITDLSDLNMEVYDNSRYLQRIERYRKEQIEIEKNAIEATGTETRRVMVVRPENYNPSGIAWKASLGVMMVLVAIGAILYSIVNRKAIRILNRK